MNWPVWKGRRLP